MSGVACLVMASDDGLRWLHFIPDFWIFSHGTLVFGNRVACLVFVGSVESEAQNMIRDEFGRDCETPRSFALDVPQMLLWSHEGVWNPRAFAQIQTVRMVDSYIHVL